MRLYCYGWKCINSKKKFVTSGECSIWMKLLGLWDAPFQKEDFDYHMAIYLTSRSQCQWFLKHAHTFWSNFDHRTSVVWLFQNSGQVAISFILVCSYCPENRRWSTWIETPFSKWLDCQIRRNLENSRLTISFLLLLTHKKSWSWQLVRSQAYFAQRKICIDKSFLSKNLFVLLFPACS